jgi:hypothetical protein
MGDAFNITSAVVASGDCPNVASFPILSNMGEITLSHAEQGFGMNFPGRDTWPGVIPEGWTGPINHTLWMGEYIQGVWYILPIKEALGDYCTLGPILAPGQVPDNLTYFAGAPMQGYQPQPGESVAFFATTGDTRRMNLQAGSPGRTNVVLVPFDAGHYTTFDAGPEPPEPEPIPPSSTYTLDDVMAALAQLDTAQQANTAQILAHTTSETDRVIQRLNELRQEVIDFAEVAGKVLFAKWLVERREDEPPPAG